MERGLKTHIYNCMHYNPCSSSIASYNIYDVQFFIFIIITTNKELLTTLSTTYFIYTEIKTSYIYIYHTNSSGHRKKTNKAYTTSLILDTIYSSATAATSHSTNIGGLLGDLLLFILSHGL